MLIWTFFFTHFIQPAAGLLAVLVILLLLFGPSFRGSTQYKVRMFITALCVILLDGCPYLVMQGVLPYLSTLVFVPIGIALALLLVWIVRTGTTELTWSAFLVSTVGCLPLLLWGLVLMFFLIFTAQYVYPLVLLYFLFCYVRDFLKEKKEEIDHNSRRADSDEKEEDPMYERHWTKDETTPVKVLRLSGSGGRKEFLPNTGKPRTYVLSGAMLSQICGQRDRPLVAGSVRASMRGKTWKILLSLGKGISVLRNGQPTDGEIKLAAGDLITIQHPNKDEEHMKVSFRIMLHHQAS